MTEFSIRLLNCKTEREATDRFTCGNSTIDRMVKNSHYPTALQHAYAYEVSYRGLVLGYYMLKFLQHSIEDDAWPTSISEYSSDTIKDFSTVYIQYIAVDKNMQGQQIGTQILRFIIKEINKLSKLWPVRMVSLNALPDKVEWYQKNGFALYEGVSPLTELGGDNRYMYLDLIDDVEILSRNFGM